MDDTIRTLEGLGFTRMEAEIYVHLTRHPPATGYAVARGIGRSNANTYQSLQSLQGKGAVFVDEGDRKLWRAVPADELLHRLERRFNERKVRAAEALRNLTPPPDDDRIYRLHTADQVFDRARALLESCEEVALVELFPGPLDRLREALEAAAARGVEVSLRVYAPTEPIKGVRILPLPEERLPLEEWPAQLVTLFADGRRHLAALLSPDGEKVVQGLWSASPFLSWTYFSYAFSDFLLQTVIATLEGSGNLEEARADLVRWKKYYRYPEGGDPGTRSLKEMLSGRFDATST